MPAVKKIKIKPQIIEVITTSMAVSLAIVAAYIFQLLLLKFSTLTPAAAQLGFALILPIILLTLQRLNLRLLRSRWLSGGMELFVPPKLDVDNETISRLQTIRAEIVQHFSQQYGVPDMDWYILDWRTKHLICFDHPNSRSHFLAMNHALIKFIQQYHSVYMTDRRLPMEQELPDVIQAEMQVFMRKHSYVWAIPIVNGKDVYGICFLTLAQLKDSRLVAMADVTPLIQFAQSFCPAMNQVLLYDAIVLSQQRNHGKNMNKQLK